MQNFYIKMYHPNIENLFTLKEIEYYSMKVNIGDDMGMISYIDKECIRKIK